MLNPRILLLARNTYNLDAPLKRVVDYVLPARFAREDRQTLLLLSLGRMSQKQAHLLQWIALLADTVKLQGPRNAKHVPLAAITMKQGNLSVKLVKRDVLWNCRLR